MSVVLFINAKKAGNCCQPFSFPDNLVVRLRIIIKAFFEFAAQKFGYFKSYTFVCTIILDISIVLWI